LCVRVDRCIRRQLLVYIHLFICELFSAAMAMPEQFSLRWNDFHANLSQSFQALLEGEDLVDVTLAAGGQYVHAHKLILSVCSPYFKELFKV
ncbi:jg27282, partial [Pararge aegeria aegeria]